MAGLAALPLFLSLRAAIRAKVEAAGAERLEGEKRDASARARRATISIARPSFFAMLRRGSSQSAGFRARAKARSPARSRRGSAGRRARSGCAATSSARRCSASRRRIICRSRPMPRTSRAKSIGGIDDKARRALRAGHSVVLDATFAIGAASAPPPLARPSRRASPSTACSSRRRSRRASLASRRAGPTLPTPTLRSRARRRAEPLGERGWSPLDAARDLDRDDRARGARAAASRVRRAVEDERAVRLDRRAQMRVNIVHAGFNGTAA